MAHPHKKDASDGHSAKLHRMTRDYGAASKDNIPVESARLKMNGPEGNVGFGADVSNPRVRNDRIARRPMKSNPPKHRDGGSVLALAKGGRAKGKGHTHVNVIVAPQAGGGGGGMPPAPLAGAGAPPMPPPRPPMMPPGAGGMPPGAPPPGMAHPGMPGAMPPPGMPPGAMPPPGGMPPGLPVRKKGGRVHDDAKEDRDLIKKTLRDEGLIRSDHKRASGGRLKVNDEYGSGSGPGRLEKIGHKVPALQKPEAVGTI